jgi:hypothetical protein
MSSQININSIDKTYPVAGQDNDSQGFRNNFDAIQTALGQAKDEIEDLQNKAILKGALTNDVLDNDLGGSNIKNGSYTNFHGTVQSAEVSSSRNVSILNGSLQAYTLADNTTFTFTDWPDTGNYAKVRIHVNAKQNQVIDVGADVEVGKKYTIYTVGTTNFEPMGADPTAVFIASITGTTLSVSSVSSGVLAVNTFISGTGVTPGTKIISTKTQNPALTGEGGAGTYIIDNSQSVQSRTMSGMTTGVTFIASTKGSGTGTIQPWFEANFATEGSGDIVVASNFSLPLYLNSNGSHQVVEAWTYNGSASSPRVYMSLVGNLDATNSDFSNLDVAGLIVHDIVESESNASGALTVAGGAGIRKNLNVGGSVVITGNLQVVGTTLFESNPTITIADIGSIGNVSIVNPVPGDSLQWVKPELDPGFWSNNANAETLVVTVGDNGSGSKDVIFLDGTALSTNTSVQYGLKFEIGKKYKFSTNTSTNTSKFNYLRFSRTPDTIVNTTVDGNGNEVPGVTDTTIPYEPADGSVAYGRYTSGPNIGKIIPAGTTGAYTEILITGETPSPLYLYASKATLNTSKLGAEYPIMVSSGSVKVIGNYTVVGSQNVMVDVSATVSGLTITLPLLPNQGTYVNITDNGSASATKPITISRGNNAVLINGVQGDGLINNAYGSITLVSDGVNWTSIKSRYTGSELVTSGSISLNTSVTYFTTGTGASSNLAAGADGQVKTLAMLSHSGDMVVTVSNAGWKSGGGSGTITFNGYGDACTLQYIGSKWFVIGNNNCELDEVGGGSPAALVAAPAALNSTGKAGQLAYDGTKFYVCTATDTWANVIFDNVAGTTRAIFTGVPLAANSSGTVGQMASDNAYLYICIANNTWKRVAWTAGW